MCYKESMTWVSGSKRWLKKHHGKMYAVSCRQLQAPPNREKSRAAANACWANKARELGSGSNRPDREEEAFTETIRNLRGFAQIMRQHPPTAGDLWAMGLKSPEQWEATAERLEHLLQSGKGGLEDVKEEDGVLFGAKLPEQAYAVLVDRLKRERKPPAPRERTLSHQADSPRTRWRASPVSNLLVLLGVVPVTSGTPAASTARQRQEQALLGLCAIASRMVSPAS